MVTCTVVEEMVKGGWAAQMASYCPEGNGSDLVDNGSSTAIYVFLMLQFLDP